MQEQPQPAIVLGCHKIGLGIIRALGEKRVPVVAVSYSRMDMGYASKYVVEHHRSPHPDIDPEGFIALLQGLGNRWNGAVLIPSDDATLIPVSKQKGMLGAFFRVAADDWAVVEQCIVKKHTYALAERIGVPCPRTSIPGSIDAAKAFAREVGFPCILKPTVGHSFFERFRQKMLFVRDIGDLESSWSQLAETGIEVMLQEFIPGDDRCGVNYNSFFVNGQPLVEVTAQKIRLTPPSIGFPRVVVSKMLPELSAPATKFIRALGYDGFSCMEFKKDARDGIYRLMEINARLNLSTPLSVKAGVNFPYLLYRYALLGELPQKGNGFKEDIFWIDPGKDLTETVRSYRKERFTVKEYLRPYLRPHVFTILSLNDMGPFLKRCSDLVNEGLRRFFLKLVKGVVHEK
jgi:predicted ATP-grasp superfamily ATP-dependent carboligase